MILPVYIYFPKIPLIPDLGLQRGIRVVSVRTYIVNFRVFFGIPYLSRTLGKILCKLPTTIILTSPLYVLTLTGYLNLIS